MMLVPILFGWRLHRTLLIEPRYRRVVLALFGSLALAGFLVALNDSFSRYSLGVMVAFACPLVHAHLLRRLFAFFTKKYGREPVDVAFNFAPGLGKDRLFAIGFVLGSIFLSMFAVGLFHAGIDVK